MISKNKVAIITGAASGIGRSCSLSFAEKGVKVIAVDLNKKGVEETNLEIQRKGGKAIFIEADVSKKEEVESYFSAGILPLPDPNSTIRITAKTLKKLNIN